MTAYKNLSFETGDLVPRENVAGDSLLADNWTSSGVSAAVEYIDFGEGQAVAEPSERFETAWTGIDDYKFEFLPGFVDLDPFIVNTGGDVSTSETFDFWVVNYVFDLNRLELFKFTSGTLEAESFEPGWGNDDPLFEFESTDLEAAIFGTAGNEDFEEGWSENEDYKMEFAPADLEIFLFDVFLEENEFEAFELVNNNIVLVTIAEAQTGERYEININQRVLDIVNASPTDTVLRDILRDMVNNSPEPVTATNSSGFAEPGFFIADDVLPTTSLFGVEGPPGGAGPAIFIQDVKDLGVWSQASLIDDFVDV